MMGPPVVGDGHTMSAGQEGVDGNRCATFGPEPSKCQRGNLRGLFPFGTASGNVPAVSLAGS